LIATSFIFLPNFDVWENFRFLLLFVCCCWGLFDSMVNHSSLYQLGFFFSANSGRNNRSTAEIPRSRSAQQKQQDGKSNIFHFLLLLLLDLFDDKNKRKK
jgi:hypothetical protein